MVQSSVLALMKLIKNHRFTRGVCTRGENTHGFMTDFFRLSAARPVQGESCIRTYYMGRGMYHESSGVFGTSEGRL